MKLSIVTSLGPNETISQELIHSLTEFAQEVKPTLAVEWILVSGDPKTLQNCCASVEEISKALSLRKIVGGSSRATCMNIGVKQSSGELLWFLHGDSSFSSKVSETFLLKTHYERIIYYFHLKFSGGPKAMKINEWGVRFRCYFLKTPFGDQGLVMSKGTFEALGFYDETAPYGEDHLLIRKARAMKIKILPIGTSIFTSPRKYEEGGWLKTTITHQYLWVKQILSQRLKKEPK